LENYDSTFIKILTLQVCSSRDLESVSYFIGIWGIVLGDTAQLGANAQPRSRLRNLCASAHFTPEISSNINITSPITMPHYYDSLYIYLMILSVQSITAKFL